MKRALKVMVLALAASAMFATTSFAEWVYVTKNGKKYHHENSRYATMEGVEKLSKEEAEESGYEPSKAYLKMAEKIVDQKEVTKKK